MKRVVVTGLGIVSPIGNSVDECWRNAVEGKSGIAKITQLDLSNEAVQIGGEVKNFDPLLWMEDKDARRHERFVQFAVAASKMALQDSGLTINEQNRDDVGTVIGVGVGALGFLEDQIGTLRDKGMRRVSPFTIPCFIANMAAGVVSIMTGARGPNLCPTTACASGTHAIGEGLLHIQSGRAKVIIAGGAESTICPIAFAGFANMKALTKDFNDSPTRGSRPFDKDRSGFVMGEGAGIVILEEYEHAKARGAKIYGELVGYGMTSDAFHMTQPSPGGEGAALCMQQTLRTGNLRPEDIGYINAHGTSTPANDSLETAAIKRVFADHAYKLNISSTKSMTGHLLGAAGGIEAVFAVKALETGIIPPTINLENPDPECDLNYTANLAQQKKLNAVISNSFGFGGTNACIAFKTC